MQASLGLAQLNRLNDNVKRKREIGLRYRNNLEKNKNFIFQDHEAPYSKNIYWVFGMIIKRGLNLDASKLMSFLNKNGIGTRPFFWPLHLQKALNSTQRLQNLNTSERIGKNGFYIPMGKHVKKSDQQMIVNEIKNLIHS